MDPQDGQPNRTAGIECAACGGVVAPAGVRVLAERDDLRFVEVACPACGSRNLAMLLAGADDGPRAARRAAPIDHEDVLAVRAFLAGYDGDLRRLAGTGRRHGPAPGPA